MFHQRIMTSSRALNKRANNKCKSIKNGAVSVSPLASDDPWLEKLSITFRHYQHGQLSVQTKQMSAIGLNYFLIRVA